MNHRLRFILSCTHALILMSAWAAMILGAPTLNHSLATICDWIVFILSFPLGALTNLFSGGHDGSIGDFVWYLVLMIPNSFLWGYLFAALVRDIRWFFNFFVKAKRRGQATKQNPL